MKIKMFLLMATVLLTFGMANAQKIGSAEMKSSMLYVEDENGKQIYYGNGLTGEFIGYSSEMIVSKQNNMVWCYIISNGSLKSIYGGNGIEGDIKSVNGKSVITKKGSMKCKYNISNSNATMEYCRTE